ncbi:hypothetical protein THAOC_23563, partial [Thalassiosira oceanica]
LDDRTITGGRTRAHLYPRRQRGSRQDEALDARKVVEIPVVRGRDRPVPLDEVYHAAVEEYERDLHHRAVPAVERRDEVRVPRQADEEVELVRLEADALRVSRGLEPPHQDDNGGKAAHVAAKADGVQGHVVCGLLCVLSIAALTRVIKTRKSTAPTKYVVKLASGAKLAAPRAKTRAAANG